MDSLLHGGVRDEADAGVGGGFALGDEAVAQAVGRGLAADEVVQLDARLSQARHELEQESALARRTEERRQKNVLFQDPIVHALYDFCRLVASMLSVDVSELWTPDPDLVRLSRPINAFSEGAQAFRRVRALDDTGQPYLQQERPLAPAHHQMMPHSNPEQRLPQNRPLGLPGYTVNATTPHFRPLDRLYAVEPLATQRRSEVGSDRPGEEKDKAGNVMLPPVLADVLQSEAPPMGLWGQPKPKHRSWGESKHRLVYGGRTMGDLTGGSVGHLIGTYMPYDERYRQAQSHSNTAYDPTAEVFRDIGRDDFAFFSVYGDLLSTRMYGVFQSVLAELRTLRNPNTRTWTVKNLLLAQLPRTKLAEWAFLVCCRTRMFASQAWARKEIIHSLSLHLTTVQHFFENMECYYAGEGILPDLHKPGLPFRHEWDPAEDRMARPSVKRQAAPPRKLRRKPDADDDPYAHVRLADYEGGFVAAERHERAANASDTEIWSDLQ